MPLADSSPGHGSIGRSSPRVGLGGTRGSDPEERDGVGVGTQGLNKAGFDWNSMHDKYKEQQVAEWRNRKGPPVRDNTPALRWSPELMRREREQRKVRMEERNEKEEKRREEQSRLNKEATRELKGVRDRLEDLRLQGILDRKEHNRQLRERALRQQEEEATAEALRAREERERAKEMKLRELRYLSEFEGIAFRLEKAEQEACRKRTLMKIEDAQKKRAEEAARERETRKQREKEAKFDQSRYVREKQDEMKKAATKRGQDLETRREARTLQTQNRLRDIKSEFDHQAEGIVISRRQREKELRDNVKARRDERENARIHSESRVKKYIVFSSPSHYASSPSPMAVPPAPSGLPGLGS